MSENASPTPVRKPDRRVARTRDRLGDALIRLLLAKPFDDITVQEVLDGAGSAGPRSTNITATRTTCSSATWTSSSR